MWLTGPLNPGCFQTASSSESVAGRNAGEIDDVMIKDPYCEAYFPEKKCRAFEF